MENQKIKIVVALFGQTYEIACKLLKYDKPFLKIETRQGVRILHENVVKEIVPLP